MTVNLKSLQADKSYLVPVLKLDSACSGCTLTITKPCGCTEQANAVQQARVICLIIPCACSRSQQAPPQHPVHNYKAWTRSSGGFLSLVQPAAATELDELVVPSVNLQVCHAFCTMLQLSKKAQLLRDV